MNKHNVRFSPRAFSTNIFIFFDCKLKILSVSIKKIKREKKTAFFQQKYFFRFHLIIENVTFGFYWTINSLMIWRVDFSCASFLHLHYIPFV